MLPRIRQSRDCRLPAQVTYDLKRAGEDEPGVAKQNERLRFSQMLVDTLLTHPRRGDPLRVDPLRGDVPTGPRSVLPRTKKVTRRRGPNQSQPIEHPRHFSKKPLPKTQNKEFHFLNRLLTKTETVADPFDFSWRTLPPFILHGRSDPEHIHQVSEVLVSRGWDPVKWFKIS